MNRLKRIIKNIFNLFSESKIRIDKAANYYSETNARNIKGNIYLGKGSTLKIGKNVQINGQIRIDGSSEVNIQKDVVINNTRIIINNSKVTLCNGAIFDCPLNNPNNIEIINGEFFLGEKAKIQSDILVRFGGILSIGDYTGISYNTEIRCEEEIHIGAYCLISYDVCIFDTNTHSTDWEERRERIKISYPSGCGEIHRPNTSPIRIGNDVWFGKGATVTKGVEIGDRSIIGIRTTVPSGIYENDSIIVNVKPKVIKRRQSNENNDNK